jgi:hypothetical protein
MKGLSTAAAALALGAVLTAPVAVGASGGGPPAFHFHQEDAGLDPDFCGTGKTVAYEGRVNAVSWIGETGGDLQELKLHVNSRTTLTNPVTGAAVVDSVAAQFTNEIVIGVESGPHTHESTVHGLPEKLQRLNGAVLIRDAGTLTYRTSFDADDNVTGFEIVRDSGNHAGFRSGRWCQVAVAELGL